jgi:2,4-dienoyl-CoA reductase-like NADH-dependent reductase (Old Yellow Enzyme family)
MAKLFEKSTINGMNLDNRFVRSATWEAMANEDGSCSQRLADVMVRLARGGVGLIISGHTYVSKEGQAGPRQLGIYSDDLVPGLKDMVDAVHRENGRIVLQLAHAGCVAARQLTGKEPLGPSIVENKGEYICRQMTRAEIESVVDDFGKASSRAKQAGFDGVQIHAAHGYLLTQFLSPYFNKRSDEYGGPVEHRAKIVLDVLKNMRASVGDRFPVLIKMNSEDFLEGGLKQDEMLTVAAMLEKSGIDSIELSGGTFLSGQNAPIRRGKIGDKKKDAYYREAAKLFKENIHVPLMLVGGIRSYETALELVEDGITDYVSLCRPLIREPDLVNRWEKGDVRKSQCLSDNLCFGPISEGEGVYCVTEKRTANRGKSRDKNSKN